MTLFTRATELQVLLEAANAADASDELLSRGRVIRDDLLEAAEHLENVRAYRSVIGREDVQPLEAKVIRQAVGGFRGALSRSGPKALQQQAAATLLKIAGSSPRGKRISFQLRGCCRGRKPVGCMDRLHTEQWRRVALR